MALFLDSAVVEEARRAAALGFVWGATTNPALMAQVDRPPAEIIVELCDLLPGTIFYQLTAPTVKERQAEALRVIEINPVKVGVKIPCTTENLSLLAYLTDQGITCAATAIFGAYQAYLACEAGAQYVIPYVNRSTRLQGDGINLVNEIRAVVMAADTGTQVLAASIKTPGEAVEALISGAHHLSLSLDLIMAMGEHSLSQQAIVDFERAMRGTEEQV